MKSTMTSVQPYWVFLIISEAKGWKIPQKKEVEVRKDYPKAEDWDRRNFIYCGQNKASFNRIPKEYQPLMRPFLGKVVAECEIAGIQKIGASTVCHNGLPLYSYYPLSSLDKEQMCLDADELYSYGIGKTLYGWTITNLKVYDTPKELKEFETPCTCTAEYEGETYSDCLFCDKAGDSDYGIIACDRKLKRSPQSWGYVVEA